MEERYDALIGNYVTSIGSTFFNSIKIKIKFNHQRVNVPICLMFTIFKHVIYCCFSEWVIK